ncbi:MAG TPA: hypothetical protein VFV85_02000, partial [Conexibacter sp.]|nr:hypothetical protein [Conexibacter sp.]
MLRLPLLAATLALLASAAAPSARAADAPPAGASVTIAPSDGGAPRTLALAALASRFDVHGVTYALRAADGGTSRVTVADGISLGALLDSAGLADDPFAYAQVARGDGSSAFVLAENVNAGADGPPVVWADAQGVHFLRPSAGGDDANAADEVTAAGGPLALTLRRGQPLVPRISASKLRARPREPIDFSASLAGGAALAPGLEFQWYFGAGRYASDASLSHR